MDVKAINEEGLVKAVQEAAAHAIRDVQDTAGRMIEGVLQAKSALPDLEHGLLERAALVVVREVEVQNGGEVTDVAFRVGGYNYQIASYHYGDPPGTNLPAGKYRAFLILLPLSS